MSPSRTLWPALLLALHGAAQAMSVCASDRQPQPAALLERFINADCDTCWRDPATPRPAANELALDWILPGSRGEDAPLSMGASRDTLERLQALGRKAPPHSDAVRTAVRPSGHRLRIAQGEPVNDYIGTSIAVTPGRTGPVRAWLLLVETLPAGAEGSPVARNLVRNVFQPSWPSARAGRKLEEARPMQIHEGTRPGRLRLVGLVEDAQGRLVVATQTRCTDR